MKLYVLFSRGARGNCLIRLTQYPPLLASYQMAWNIAPAKQPYNDGEFVKKCLRDVVEIFSPENNKLKRMISDVQLSRHTVERRISDISMSIKSKLHSDFQACEYFSIALDESCDIQDKPQLAIFDGLFQTIV